MSNAAMAGKRATKAPKTDVGKVFGSTLARIRDDRKLTQEALAHEAGLTTNYTSDLQRGQKVPSLSTIIQLAHALGCAPADLLADFTPAQVKQIALDAKRTKRRRG